MAPTLERGMIMQVLTVKDVVDGVKKAIANNTLLALRPEKTQEGQCFYEVGGCRCAIGASLTLETLLEIKRRGLDDSTGVCGLDNLGLITITSWAWMQSLQWAHDAWARAAYNIPLYSEEYRLTFMEILDEAPQT